MIFRTELVNASGVNGTVGVNGSYVSYTFDATFFNPIEHKQVFSPSSYPRFTGYMARAYHNYTVTWTPHYILWSLDAVPFFNQTRHNGFHRRIPLGLGRLPFSFGGLVVASVLYSMPFVVQPIAQAFEAIPERMLEAAATLRASRLDRFFSVALPLARPGVVLMIGGNIPGQTRVLSVAIYEHVEASEFDQAHQLAAGLVLFALLVLVTLYRVNRVPRDEAAS